MYLVGNPHHFTCSDGLYFNVFYYDPPGSELCVSQEPTSCPYQSTVEATRGATEAITKITEDDRGLTEAVTIKKIFTRDDRDPPPSAPAEETTQRYEATRIDMLKTTQKISITDVDGVKTTKDTQNFTFTGITDFTDDDATTDFETDYTRKEYSTDYTDYATEDLTTKELTSHTADLTTERFDERTDKTHSESKKTTVIDVTDSTNVIDLTDISGVTDITDVTEVTDVTDMTDVTDIDYTTEEVVTLQKETRPPGYSLSDVTDKYKTAGTVTEAELTVQVSADSTRESATVTSVTVDQDNTTVFIARGMSHKQKIYLTS